MHDGLLIIRRPMQFNGIARRYRLYVDDGFLGRIAAGGRLQLRLPVGEHRFSVRMDWIHANLEVVIREDESTEVDVGAGMKWWWPFCILYARLRVVGFPVVVYATSEIGSPGTG